MNEPFKLDPADLFNFVARPGPAVLFLSVHPEHHFNRFLCECFGNQAGEEIAFGRLPLLDLLASANPALSFLHGEILACDASLPLSVPPGYYLFQRGQLIAWDSGLPSAADAKRIIRSSLLSAAFSLFTRDLSFVAGALLSAAERATAERVASRFRRAAEAYRENPKRASAHTQTTPDDLASAYRVLRVEPTASDEEVNRAWRTLQREFHPDRAMRDPEEFERLSQRCVEINRARDVIRSYRRDRRRAAAA